MLSCILFVSVEVFALTCVDRSTTYVRGIHACVSIDIADSEWFRALLLQERVCPGVIASSPSQLEYLRKCARVDGDIILANFTDDIDPTVFWDIVTVSGTSDVTHYFPFILID
jgi:hypothetical protein